MATEATTLETGPNDSTESESETKGAMTLDEWIAWSGGAS